MGDEFAEKLRARNALTQPFLRIPPARTSIHFDLPGFLAAELASAGVGTIEPGSVCTYADPAHYFSHRYATHHATAEGRQIALIARD